VMISPCLCENSTILCPLSHPQVTIININNCTLCILFKYLNLSAIHFSRVHLTVGIWHLVFQWDFHLLYICFAGLLSFHLPTTPLYQPAQQPRPLALHIPLPGGAFGVGGNGDVGDNRDSSKTPTNQYAASMCNTNTSNYLQVKYCHLK
jgi:hypothetical protein